jgi:hypothetical protein
MGAPGTTDGPWSIHTEDDVSFYRARSVYICSSDGWPEGQVARANVMDGSGEREANARQLAASPDLYDQLAFAVKLLDNLPGFRGTAQLDRMHAALAKARGES